MRKQSQLHLARPEALIATRKKLGVRETSGLWCSREQMLFVWLAFSLLTIVIVAAMIRGDLKLWHRVYPDSSPFLIWTKQRQLGGFFKVDHDGMRYLSRWILYRGPSIRVFLHHIHRPDEDRNLHSHPWEASCLILWGGYEEIRSTVPGYLYRQETTHHYGMGDINSLEADCYHRITSVRPNTWSLVFAGPRFREWSFLVDGVPVDWKTYLKLPESARIPD